MEIEKLLHSLIPTEFQVPANPVHRTLTKIGYFRLRTWLASRGERVPNANLYQPLYSPWEGEPAFEMLYRQTQNLTLVSRDRCYLLWKTLQQSLNLTGDFVECGVFRGGTALLEARTLQGQMSKRKLHLFDSFAGMPETTDGVDSFEAGDFSRTSAEAVARLLKPYSFVEMHVGFIPDTFQGLELEHIAWVHIDVDLYQSVQECISYFYARLVPGGFMIFDDYGFPSCPGARRAVDEAFAKLPEVPICLPTGQCLVVKLR